MNVSPVELAPGVHWVGVPHPDLKRFDIIMEVGHGTTYNAYLVKGERCVLIDTVKGRFSDELLDKLESQIDPASLSAIVVQHTEPDHAGALEALLERAPDAEVICARAAVKFVKGTLNRDAAIRPVADNDTLDLGGATLRFFATPFLHWPDTMMTWLDEHQILFSCDVFGAHYCDTRLFDDLIGEPSWPEFEYYYRRIMRPFGKNVRSALKKIAPLPIRMIAPSHGPVYRSGPRRALQAYQTWSSAAEPNEPPRVLIFYASAHGNTRRMAEEIAAGISSKKADVQLFDAEVLDPEDYLDAIEAADAVLFGSPTINNDAVKPVWDVINSTATLAVKGKVAGSFGSYGWSGEAIPFLDARLSALKFRLPCEGLSAVLVPGETELKSCFEFGIKIASAVRES